jgi:hypothetical protein
MLYAPLRSNAGGGAFSAGSAPCEKPGCSAGLIRYFSKEKSTPPTTALSRVSKTRAGGSRVRLSPAVAFTPSGPSRIR